MRDYAQCMTCICDSCEEMCELKDESCDQCDLIGPDTIDVCPEELGEIK
jgi:hypothetical protein